MLNILILELPQFVINCDMTVVRESTYNYWRSRFIRIENMALYALELDFFSNHRKSKITITK